MNLISGLQITHMGLVNEIVIEGAPSSMRRRLQSISWMRSLEGEEDVVWSESAGQFVCNETIYRTLNSIDS